MHITYPAPEPVAPPRAREGLRAVVPTIFPPGAVNRGPAPSLHGPQTSGPMPTPRFEGHKRRAAEEDEDEEDDEEEEEEEQASDRPHTLAELQGADEMRLLEAVRRHPEPHGHKRRHRHLHHTHKRPHRTDTHRTKDGAAYLAPVHFKHRSKVNPSRRPPPAAAAGPLPRTEKPYFLDRPSPTRLDGVDAAAWRPSVGAMETVLVTDVTTNFLTVTIKESSSSKGFFRDMKRAAGPSPSSR